MIDIRKSYLRAPGRWKIVRAILVLLGLVVTSVFATRNPAIRYDH